MGGSEIYTLGPSLSQERGPLDQGQELFPPLPQSAASQPLQFLRMSPGPRLQNPLDSGCQPQAIRRAGSVRPEVPEIQKGSRPLPHPVLALWASFCWPWISQGKEISSHREAQGLGTVPSSAPHCATLKSPGTQALPWCWGHELGLKESAVAKQASFGKVCILCSLGIPHRVIRKTDIY
jgi:hypothetical protein